MIPKAIWVGPNKTEINAELLKDFDFVGLSPGTLVTNMPQNTNEDQGILDVDFLEFNELETDALAETTEDLEFSELDIDFLDVDFLTDLLDVIEELEKTKVSLGDTQTSGGEIGRAHV